MIHRSNRSAGLLLWGDGELGFGDVQRNQSSLWHRDVLQQEQRDHRHDHRSWTSTHGELVVVFSLLIDWFVNWSVAFCGAVVWQPGDSEVVEWGLAERGLCVLCGLSGSRPCWACMERGEDSTFNLLYYNTRFQWCQVWIQIELFPCQNTNMSSVIQMRSSHESVCSRKTWSSSMTSTGRLQSTPWRPLILCLLKKTASFCQSRSVSSLTPSRTAKYDGNSKIIF